MNRFTLAFFFTIGLSVSTQSFASSACDLLMRGGIAAETAQAVSRLLEIPKEVIQARAAPRWEHFEALAKAYQALHLLPGAELKEIGEILRKKKAIPESILPAGSPLSSSALLGEAQLKEFFRRDLIALNDVLPAPLQYRLDELPPLLVPARESIEQAEVLVSNSSARIEPTLKKLGPEYQSFDLLKREIKKEKKKTKWFAEVHSLLKNPERVRLSMRRPESSRFWLPKSGFQSQRITGTSKGMYDPNMRSSAERVLLGIKKREFSALPADVLPKYGYLRFGAEEAYSLYSIVSNYGEDIFDFKAENVSKRTSFTLGDSLNYGYRKKDLSFGRLFTPLEYLPYVSLFLNPQRSKNPYLQELIHKAGKVSYNTFYIELQIFGPLDLDDVETFTFTQTPPSGEFLKELMKRGIAIKDGRGDADHPVSFPIAHTLDR